MTSVRIIASIRRAIVACESCPRLRRHCTTMAQLKRKAYASETYWGRPIPGFGDPQARVIIVGLAPAAHGANRTGRIFTGDRSGDWLYRALHKAGFANQPTSVSANDGLKLKDTYITCVVRCAPPDNKPSPRELERCSPFLEQELAALTEGRVFIALGRIAYDRLWPLVGEGRKPAFSHGGQIPLSGGRALLLSYHPSQQNTFTGRLTEEMFDSVFSKARQQLLN